MLADNNLTIKNGDNMRKLTDNFGNDLLDENGCVQYVAEQLSDINKETIYYALSRLLDDDMPDDEFNYLSDLRDKFSVDKEQVNITCAKEGYKACAICKEFFKPSVGAVLTETRHLCALCRKAGA